MFVRFCLNGKIYRGKSKKIEKLRFLKYAIIKKIKTRGLS